MKYIELYNFVKREAENMEFKRFLILVLVSAFTIISTIFIWRVPELIEAMK